MTRRSIGALPGVVLLALLAGCGRGRTAQPPGFEGYHDITNCNGISGWAWDSRRPDDPIDIDLYDGSAKFATVKADTFRQDLLDAGKGNGRHGFLIPTPAALQDGRSHSLYMKYAGTDDDLLNGPKVISCPTAR